MPVRILLSLWILSSVSLKSQARVFSYKDAGVAPFVKVTGGLSALSQNAFDDSSGIDTALEGESKYSYSGELGLSIALSNSANIRLGAELIEHRPVDGKGKNASGVERFALRSTVVAFNPNVTLEFIYKNLEDVRFFFYCGAGYADITVDNRYTLSATGTSELGVNDFSEKLSTISYSSHAGIGLETHFVDNVTFVADFGYRYLPVRSLKYKGDVNNIINPSGASKGEEALNHDGNSRNLDLSGIYASLAFRFYLNFL